MKEKVAIYSRKSKYTGLGESTKNQITSCLDYLRFKYGNLNNLDIKIFEDEGFSGGNTNRPKFKEMLNCFEKENYSILIVYKLDRISRNVLDFCSLKEILDLHNINFISITENFDTSSPMGNAMMMISSVFAQLEREQIKERIKDNMTMLAKKGNWLGGNAPLGYDSIRCEKIENGKKRFFYILKENKDIEIVKIIFNKFLEEKSINKVLLFLKNNSIRTKLNNNFTRFSIKQILENIVYSINDLEMYNYLKSYDIDLSLISFDGKHSLLAYNKTSQSKNKNGIKKTIYNDISKWIISNGSHKGIIPGYIFVEVQNLLKNNRTAKHRSYAKSNVQSLLTEIIVCNKCSSHLRPRTRNGMINNKRKFVYMCTLKEKSHKAHCDSKNINGNLLDEIVLQKILSLDFDKNILKKELIHLKNKNELYNKNKLIEKQITKTKNKISNLIKSISYMDKKNIVLINDEINLQKEILHKLTDKFKEIQNVTYKSMDILQNYKSSFEDINLYDKRTFIKNIIKKIVVSDVIEIYFQ